MQSPFPSLSGLRPLVTGRVVYPELISLNLILSTGMTDTNVDAIRPVDLVVLGRWHYQDGRME